MTDTKTHASGSGSLEGKTFRPTNPQEIAEAVELAFDYRGDVTIETTSGESIVGYIYNRDAAGSDPSFEVFPAESPSPRRIPYAAVASLAFTGEDTADGKSWEAWANKKESERRAEAEKVEADARSRGLL